MDTDWLENLKVGDKVILVSTHPTYIYSVVKITNITPTGRIKVEGEERYFIRGFCKGSHKWDTGKFLKENTPAAYHKYIRGPQILSYLKEYNWNKLTPDQRAEIYSRINEMEEGEVNEK